MLCTRCNTNVQDGLQVCPNCGGSLMSQSLPMCPNCRIFGQPGEKFCRNCGTQMVFTNVSNQPIPNNAGYNQYQNAGGFYGTQDDYLLKAYTGLEPQIFNEKKFSWGTFFFGIYYLLYRKMYTIALTWWGINFILILFLPNSIYNLLSFIANITVSFMFWNLYKKDASDKINKIRTENPNIQGNDLIALLNKKGGTNIALPIILFIVVVVLNAFLLVDDNSIDSDYPYASINAITEKMRK